MAAYSRAFAALCCLTISSGLIETMPRTNLRALHTTGAARARPGPACTTGAARAARHARARMGLLDDVAAAYRDAIQEFTQEATVQHILVPTQSKARELYDSLLEEAGGASSDAVGSAARQHSTCGSAKKRPDARMAQLRGAPGELKFRRGEMAKEFEEAAFAGPVGELQRPFQTQFGWHVMLVNSRTGE